VKIAVATAATVLVLSGAAGCGSDDDGGSTETTITVYAASSLKTAFTELGAQFEAAHEGVTVQFNFAGSSDLVAQVQQGAPADVIATADTANMDKLVDGSLLGTDPENFASNTMEIAVPPGNPAGVTSLADLAGKGVNLVLCAPEVPCGAAAEKIQEIAQLTFHPVSEEQNVTDVLNKVITGEADAGLVYVTDIQAAGDQVEGVTFPEAAEAVNTYPIAEVGDAHEPDLAQAFIDLVLGEQGRTVLQDAGFAQP